MELKEFNRIHGELIMYLQIIENDLKWIYSFINKEESYEDLDRSNLGETLMALKEVDKTTNAHLFTDNDYRFLSNLRRLRNYYVHNCYIDFIYVPQFLNSKAYYESQKKLLDDYKKIQAVAKALEKLKIQAKQSYK